MSTVGGLGAAAAAPRACGVCCALDSGAGGGGLCARCKHVWYCGAKCQRAAWGGHKAECARAVAAAPAAPAAAVAVAARRYITGADAGPGGGGGGIVGDAAAMRRALALLSAPSMADQRRGLEVLRGLRRREGDSHTISLFYDLLAAEGGVPIIVRAMMSPLWRGHVGPVALVADLASAMRAAVVSAGAVPPLVALLVSPVVIVQEAAARALRSLCANGAHARARRSVTCSLSAQSRTGSRSLPRALCLRLSRCSGRQPRACGNQLRWLCGAWHWVVRIKYEYNVAVARWSVTILVVWARSRGEQDRSRGGGCRATDGRASGVAGHCHARGSCAGAAEPRFRWCACTCHA